jgi:hypothetical protein
MMMVGFDDQCAAQDRPALEAALTCAKAYRACLACAGARRRDRNKRQSTDQKNGGAEAPPPDLDAGAG